MKEIMFNNKLPKINYIGNKEKLSSWILDNFPITQGRVLDLFAGGSSVSFESKKRGFEVYSNDSLYASYVVNKALIENKDTLLSQEEILKFTNFDDFNLRKQLSWLENTLYYPNEIDELSKLVFFSNHLKGYKKFLLQSLIRRAMIRKLPYSRMNLDWNNILKLRDEEYSYKKYGRRRAYHNEPFINHILSDLNCYNNAIFDNKKQNKVFQLDALQAIKKSKQVDIIYLDPPYPGTMNNYDSFYGKFDEIFRKKIDYIDITNRSNFLPYFEKIVELASVHSKYLVLSLNSASQNIFDIMVEMFEFYGDVKVKEKKHNYQVSGKNTKNKNIEMIAIVKFYK